MHRSEPPPESPAELVERIRSGGDSEAEARLVERYARGVRLILDRHTRSTAEAEDLLQETLGIAISKLRSGALRDPEKLAGFLSSLARNLAIEHYRKVGRRQTEADSETAEATVAVGEGQLGELLRDEEAALVRRCLEGLTPERDREILFRFYIAEEDKAAIAADHGLTRSQFNRVLHRARQRYKALYLGRLDALGQARTLAAIGFFLTWALAIGAIIQLPAPLKS